MTLIIYDTPLACLGHRNKVVVQTIDISFLTVLEAGGWLRVPLWSGSGAVSSHLVAGTFMLGHPMVKRDRSGVSPFPFSFLKN